MGITVFLCGVLKKMRHRDNNLIYNSAAIISRKNIKYYHKTTLTKYDKTYFNAGSDILTFTCKNEKIPISLKMEVNRTLAKYYWLYWRLYDTYIDKQQLENIFENDNKIQKYFRFAKYLKLYTEDNEHIFLTERGAFWIHLLQNYFVLNYIDKVWSVSMKDPWPKMIRI